jgi:hypothetical protein
MLVRYKEVPTWWYFIILTVAFVFGIIVTTTQNITMPVWSYIIALSTGAFVAPFVSGENSKSRNFRNFSFFEAQRHQLMAVHNPLLPLWLRDCYELPHEDSSWRSIAWKTSRKSLLFILVPQCDFAESKYGK